jgi:hypothetical protein
MLKSTMIGAALLVSAAITVPASAAVIDEPGNFAFVYPNGDLGIGTSQPADALAQAPARGGDLGGMRMSARHHRGMHASTIKHY